MRWFMDACWRWAEARQPLPPDPKPQPELPPEQPAATTTAQLSPNFSLRELTRSRTARARGIDNMPSPEHVNNLRVLVGNVLQPARNALGAITVTSGYRSPELNRAVRGSATSDHMRGMAADIVPTGSITLEELGKWIQDNCMFKQLIYEYGEWLHVSYDPDDLRQQVLEAYHVVVGHRRNGTPIRQTRYRPFVFK